MRTIKRQDFAFAASLFTCGTKDSFIIFPHVFSFFFEIAYNHLFFLMLLFFFTNNAPEIYL